MTNITRALLPLDNTEISGLVVRQSTSAGTLDLTGAPRADFLARAQTPTMNVRSEVARIASPTLRMDGLLRVPIVPAASLSLIIGPQVQLLCRERNGRSAFVFPGIKCGLFARRDCPPATLRLPSLP